MSGADLSASPLAASFERLAALKEELYLNARLGLPSGAPEDNSWTPLRKLTEDGESLREHLRLMRERWDLSNRNAAIGVVGHLVWQVGGAAIFLYATERRVPDLSPENITLRLADGGIEEVAFTSGRFAALSNDPASESAVATFEDEDGLRGWLREGLERMLDPVISEVRAATRVGKRTMYNRAADLAAQRMMGMDGVTGDGAWCGREAEKLVKSPDSPLDGATRFFTVEHEGREEIFLVRGCCCHAYKEPEHGYCGTCPLLSQEELEKRAAEAMAG